MSLEDLVWVVATFLACCVAAVGTMAILDARQQDSHGDPT